MIKIEVNAKTKDLGLALADLCICHLQFGNTHVTDHDSSTLRIKTEQVGGDTYTVFLADDPASMLPLLQLTEAVLGLEMDHFDIAPVFIQKGGQQTWEYLKQWRQGQPKVKRTIALITGLPQSTHLDNVRLSSYNIEQMCLAYAMWAEDPRVSMAEWLQMIPTEA
jgi:hypothetical protein